jgi:NADPH-dependent curcumin reductase
LPTSSGRVKSGATRERARNRQVRLASHPSGVPELANFELFEEDVPQVTQGRMLCRTIYLSLDPYMRGRMSPGPSYARGVALGEVMVGRTVARVVESKLEGFEPGDFVLTSGGWQEYALSDGVGVRKLDPGWAPISTALGVLGMPGLTAYVGLLDIGRARAGETVVVSAAAGAVGTVVGQLARIVGCRVVGVAGASEKCDYVTRELGFDACVSHRSDDLAGELAVACPEGIDVYFDNVGGGVFETVLPLLNDFARVPICGRISTANDTEPPPGPNQVPRLLASTLVKRLTLRGFLVFDHADREQDFLRDVGTWVRDGAIRYREDIVEGIENAPKAFLGLFRGANFGKLLVRVSDDPTR